MCVFVCEAAWLSGYPGKQEVPGLIFSYAALVELLSKKSTHPYL